MRTETKNLNSFRFMEEAICLEVARQIELLEAGEPVLQETRLYDPERRRSRPMRDKEEAHDYRYFPCPDLLPVEIDEATIERLRAELPELPDQREARFREAYGLGAREAALLAGDADTAAYFEETARLAGDVRLAANWIMGELAAHLNAAGLEIRHSPVSPERLAGLLRRIADGTLSSKLAKEVFRALWEGEGDADQIIAARGLSQLADEGALEQVVEAVIAAHPQLVEDYRRADERKRRKVLGGFMGPDHEGDRRPGRTAARHRNPAAQTGSAVVTATSPAEVVMSERKDKKKVVGEVFDDDRVRSFLYLEAPTGVDPDYHRLERAYRGMNAENFATFVRFFVEAGGRLDARGPHGRTILEEIARHRHGEPYAAAIRALEARR
ncbi:MAG: hypothetical protein KatS3mg124_1565 [Porticoccaceae bacterium]|nr:MAG: hypothetical protein KatS3mg124_1565 [Porticoccaceae bacterium]